jgi:hypothetical protein
MEEKNQQQAQAPKEKRFKLEATESEFNQVLNSLSQLPWVTANPLIQFIQTKVQEIKEG